MTTTPTTQRFTDLNAHNFGERTVAETLADLEALIERGKGIDSRKADTCAEVAQLKSMGGQISYPHDGGMFAGVYTLPQTMSDHAWGQMLAKLAPVVFGKGNESKLFTTLSGFDAPQDNERGARSMPKRYLSAIPTELLDTILNYHFEHAPQGRNWWMRSINDATTPDTTIRAVVGPRYPVTFGNTGLIEMVHGLINRHQAKFPAISLIRPTLNDNELNMRVVYYSRDTDDGPYGVGFMLRNNELGLGHYSLYGLVQRGRCKNSIAVDLGDVFHVRHNGSTPTIKELLYTGIGTALKLGDDLIDSFLNTREVEIPDFDDVIDGLALKYGNVLDDTVKGIVRKNAAQDGGATKFGLINGLTYAAHSAEELNARQRGDLEVLGGSMIAASGSLFAQAAKAARAQREGLKVDLNFAPVALNLAADDE